MSKIKVGEYIRTKNGYIGKYIIQQNINYIDTGKNYIGFDIENDIVKCSPNIIDLIEVGDYVNGYYVEKVWEQVNYRMAIDLRGSYLGLSDEKFIKSIVTKERFKESEYRINE